MAKVALISGASSGIGKAIAEVFAANGYSLALVARRVEILESLCAGFTSKYPNQEFRSVKCDVSKWPEVEGAIEKIRSSFPAIQVLINNAGAYHWGAFEKIPMEKIAELIQVNVLGVIYLTRASLPLLKAAASPHKRAAIVNLGSIAGLWGFSNMAVYSSSKYAVTGLSASLRRELKGQNIDVGSIFPGPVDTKEGAKARKLTVLPETIAKQVLEMAEKGARDRVSNPIFMAMDMLDRVSPPTVDKLLKKLL